MPVCDARGLRIDPHGAGVLILGQSAGTAACITIDDDCSVQAVTCDKLRARLIQDGQKLEYGDRKLD